MFGLFTSVAKKLVIEVCNAYDVPESRDSIIEEEDLKPLIRNLALDTTTTPKWMFPTAIKWITGQKITNIRLIIIFAGSNRAFVSVRMVWIGEVPAICAYHRRAKGSPTRSDFAYHGVRKTRYGTLPANLYNLLRVILKNVFFGVNRQ